MSEKTAGETIKVNNFEIHESGVKPNRRFLYFAACAVNLFSFCGGIALGWTSPIIPKLEKPFNGNLVSGVTSEESSWIGSLLPLGAAIGPFAAGLAADKFGRKNTILMSVMPLALSFPIFAYAHQVSWFYFGRFLSGLSIGCIFTVLPIYIGEISEDDNRGTLGSFLQLFIVTGLLFAYITGHYIPMPDFNLYSCLLLVLSIFLFYFYIPETPHFYFAQEEPTKAKKALMKLRSASEDQVADELRTIKQSVDGSGQSKGGFSEVFKNRASKRALGISISLVTFQQFCGINVVLFYTQTIFSATGTTIPPEIATIIIGAVQVVSSALTPMVVDRLGKRILLISSAGMMCLSEAALGFYFYYLEKDVDVSAVFWLPITSLIIYMIFYCLGLGPLPWAVMGEIFSPDVKSAASTITASVCWLFAFLLTKLFANVVVLIGVGGSFGIFSACCAFASICIYKFVPETKGKSFEEILIILSK